MITALFQLFTPAVELCGGVSRPHQRYVGQQKQLDSSTAMLYIFLYMYRRCAMEAITYTNARQNLAKTMEKVCQDHSPVIVTRKQNDSVVILSLEDYKALEETAYLLRSPKNMRRLIESVSQLENEEGTERDLIE
jgi:antitoxin YefM